MSFDLDDTIAAVASPPGSAVRGIVRVSGKEVVSLVSQLLAIDAPQSGPPVRLRGNVLAESIGPRLTADVLLWPGTRSYTGQPMAEFHVIGSPPVLELLLLAIIETGARPAERGEFTMRAFLNGRIDLLQAEAVVGVIDAADHEQLQAALTQLGGGLTQQLREIRTSMIAILGDLEAGLDFVEEDIEFISSTEMIRRLNEARGILAGLLSDSEERLPSGYRPVIVLAGLPNAGKSTLFNRLAEADLAIASTVAGTTRDYLSCQVTIDGLTVVLVDTAGWDQSGDDIMSTAQHLRQEQLNSADLVIWCTAADLNDNEQAANDQLLAEDGLQATPLISLATCIDRLPADSDLPGTQGVSAVSGAGLAELRRCIASTLTKNKSDRIELLATTSARCRDSIQQAIVSIDSAVDSATGNLGDEITAIGLREALRELRSMLGETWTDDILDHIFSSFCIGK
jgi:tRNA modification GTPase